MKTVKLLLTALLAATALATIGAPAGAADIPAKGPVYKAPAFEPWNPWTVRVRALGVVTRNSGNVDQAPG
jgi:outer membrane protein